METSITESIFGNTSISNKTKSIILKSGIYFITLGEVGYFDYLELKTRSDTAKLTALNSFIKSGIPEKVAQVFIKKQYAESDKELKTMMTNIISAIKESFNHTE